MLNMAAIIIGPYAEAIKRVYVGLFVPVTVTGYDHYTNCDYLLQASRNQFTGKPNSPLVIQDGRQNTTFLLPST